MAAAAATSLPPRDHGDDAYYLAQLRLAQPIALIAAVLLFALTARPSTASPPRRRTGLLSLVLLTTFLSYLVAGALIVLRAVVPSKYQVWTPALPLWHNLDVQIILALVAIALVLLHVAWQQRQYGPGKYTVQVIYAAAVIGGILDVAQLALYALSKSTVPEWKATAPWTWAQLAIYAVRILLLWPLLAVLSSISAQAAPLHEAAHANDLAENTAAAASTSQEAPTERSSLLDPNTANGTPRYGTSSAGPSTNGRNTPTKNGHHGPVSAASANASMGLSMASAPPPPTLRVFFNRIVILFPYLWPSKSPSLQFLACVCVALLIIGRAVNLAVPLMLGKIVDRLAGNDGAATFSVWWLIGGYALLRCLQGSGGFLTVLQNMAWLPLQQYSDRQMSLMAFRHLLDLSMSFHTKRKTGEVLRILDRGSSINNFFQYLIFSITPIFFDIAIAAAFLSMTFGPQIGILLFVIMSVYTTISVQMTTWRTGLRREANNKDSVSRAIHTDVLLNWETVKSYNNEGYESERYRLSLLDYQRADWKVNASLNVLNLVQNLILSIGTLFMLFVVAYGVVSGRASSSDFVVFISYLAQIYQPLNMLSTLYRVIQTSLVDTDKLIALLSEEKDVKDVPGAKDLEVQQGVLEFRNVKFSYDGKVEALKGLSFTIKPKSKVALVGESGAGKSSVLRLLYRFYDPSSGQILIDGQDIRTVTQNSLRRAIGVVPQEAGLLNTSIRTNIGYGRTEPPATDEEVEAAAAAAQILDKINTFPEGMDTVVGERGVRLSGGEKQRVAIARTFLKAPPILLLDEATSALDSQTERQLQAALQTLMEGKTSLTIAHRLSTIVNSDQIIVLNNGQVVESGTHEELIAIPEGRYAAMWRAQVETDKERAGKEKGSEAAEAQAVGAGAGAGAGVGAGAGADADAEAPAASPSPSKAGKERAIDIPAMPTETAEQPKAGMLGVVSPSQVDADVIQREVAKSPSSAEIDAKAAASGEGATAAVVPAEAEPVQDVSLPSVAEVSNEASDSDQAAPQEEQAVPTAAPEPKSESIAAAAAAAAPAPASAADVSAAPSVKGKDARDARDVAFPDVPGGAAAPEQTSATAATGPGGKIRRRITSLMRRSNSHTGGDASPGSGPASPSLGAEPKQQQQQAGSSSPTLNRNLSLGGPGSGSGAGAGSHSHAPSRTASVRSPGTAPASRRESLVASPATANKASVDGGHREAEAQDGAPSIRTMATGTSQAPSAAAGASISTSGGGGKSKKKKKGGKKK